MNAMENLLQTALSGVQQEKIIKPNYNKFNIPSQELAKLLQSCYEAEVFNRGRSEVQHVEELNTIARWLHISILKPWLLIYGTVGNGKTTTAKAIKKLYETLIASAKDQLQRGNYELQKLGSKCYDEYLAMSLRIAPKIISAQEICVLAANDKEAFNQLKSASILIIDDIGIEPLRVVNFGTELSPIADLLYFRYDHQLMTIMTTNKDYDQLCEIYGERIKNRFKEVMSKIGYTAKSFR